MVGAIWIFHFHVPIDYPWSMIPLFTANHLKASHNLYHLHLRNIIKNAVSVFLGKSCQNLLHFIHQPEFTGPAHQDLWWDGIPLTNFWMLTFPIPLIVLNPRINSLVSNWHHTSNKCLHPFWYQSQNPYVVKKLHFFNTVMDSEKQSIIRPTRFSASCGARICEVWSATKSDPKWIIFWSINILLLFYIGSSFRLFSSIEYKAMSFHVKILLDVDAILQAGEISFNLACSPSSFPLKNTFCNLWRFWSILESLPSFISQHKWGWKYTDGGVQTTY